MTNTSTNAPHVAQNPNTSSEYLAIDFSHRLPTAYARKDRLSFVDTVDHFAYRAIGILEVMKKGDYEISDALNAAISEIEDVRATAIAYAKHIESQTVAVNLAEHEHLNTNPQT